MVFTAADAKVQTWRMAARRTVGWDGRADNADSTFDQHVRWRNGDHLLYQSHCVQGARIWGALCLCDGGRGRFDDSLDSHFNAARCYAVGVVVSKFASAVHASPNAQHCDKVVVPVRRIARLCGDLPIPLLSHAES